MSQERKQNRKRSSENICLLKVCDIEKNVKRLPGTPDIVLQKYKAVIFVNGCFWHGHQGCKYAHLPSTNLEYWEKKIADKLERDKRKTQELERLGYQVSVVWQCQLKPKVREQNLRNLYNNIVEHT